jgi:3-methyladenine DNA glycosylase AlkD
MPGLLTSQDQTFMHPYIKGLHHEFRKKRNAENAASMKQYMRNQFDFFGLKSVDRRTLCKLYMLTLPLPEGRELHKIVIELWALPERDFQYFAIELLMKCKKQWDEKDISLFEKLIVNKSWWDTVDYLANQVVGPWFRKYPQHIKPVTNRWNQSDNIWLQRMSLLFQLKYKDDTDYDLLFRYIKNLSGSGEFFVQKAIGWVLREYSKTDPDAVLNFLKLNELKPLSRREAVKVIERSGL